MGKELRRFGDRRVNCAAISPDGSRVLSGHSNGNLYLWDTETGVELRSLKGHTADIRGVAFSHDGLHAVSGGGFSSTLYMQAMGAMFPVNNMVDCSVRLWDLKSGDEVRHFDGQVTKP